MERPFSRTRVAGSGCSTGHLRPFLPCLSSQSHVAFAQQLQLRGSRMIHSEPCRKSQAFALGFLLTVLAIAFLSQRTATAQAPHDSRAKPSTETPEPERGYAAFYSPS